jgi:ATP-dependent Lon protease
MRSKRKYIDDDSDDDEWEADTQTKHLKKQIKMSKHEADVKTRCNNLLDQYNRDPENNHTAMAIVQLILQLPTASCMERVEASASTHLKLLEDSWRYMEESVYGHHKAKMEVLQYHTSRLLTRDRKASVLGFVGPPGIGKTSLVVNGISKALNLPFYQMSIGGMRDVTYFSGSLPCWKGAHQGVFADILIKKGKNAIVYIDEVDKIAGDTAGDIYGWLTHALDPLANGHIRDNFLGMDLDLSGLTFIFSYNNPECLPAPLRDRIKEIYLDGFTDEEKCVISKTFIIPECVANYGLSIKDIVFTDELIEYIVGQCEGEGVRSLKKFYQSLIDRLMLRITCTYEGFARYATRTEPAAAKPIVKCAPSFTGLIRPILTGFPYVVSREDVI